MNRFLVWLVVFALGGALGYAGGRRFLVSGCAVRVESTPPAGVYLDGIFQGSTPLTVEGLAPGAHAVRLEAAGHHPHQEAVQVPETRQVQAVLEPVPVASLKVTSKPGGAAVYLDAVQQGRTPLTLTGLAPGTCHVELVKTNYFPVTHPVSLVAGEESTVSVALEHRQVHTYEARIEADAYDITAYNDLGELLYVLGRYEEAASTYVRGLVAAGASHNFDETARRGIRRIAREPRAKHSDARFRKALDEAVFAALRKGETSRYLIEELRRIPHSAYPQAYRDALEACIARNGDNGPVLLDLAELYRRMGEFERTVELVMQGTAQRPQDFNLGLQGLQVLLSVLEPRRGKDAAARPAFVKLKAALAALPLKKDQKVKLRWEEGRLALAEERLDEGLSLSQEAISGSANLDQANDWRVALARKLKLAKKYAEASALLHAAIATKRNHTNGVRNAKKLLKTLPKEFRKPSKK